jgi:outer membrane protein assembly factor BamB
MHAPHPNLVCPARFLSAFARTLLLASSFAAASCFAQVNVLTQHNDNARTGANLNETTLTPSNVNSTQFGMLFKRVVDDQVYGQPLVLSGVNTAAGTHTLVYITTVANSVYAFDADDPAIDKPYWHVNFGIPANLSDANFGCTDMNGNMGIVGTPVIDPVRGALYVVALTRTSAGFIQRLHALDVATGADLPNSPVVIAADSFDALLQNQRPALLLANDTVYVGYASHCDHGAYHGFLFAFDPTSLKQTGIFNPSPTGNAASIWQSGQGPAADTDGNIYFVTGNGSWDGQSNFSESFIKLDSHLHLLDWFTPSNHEALDAKDIDLDSSGALLIPGTHLVVDGGKEGFLYLVDIARMGHLGDQNAAQHFQISDSHLHSLVYWSSAKNNSLLYVWGQKDQLRVFQFTGTNFEPQPFAIRPKPNTGHPGAMLSLSANGNKNGILWASIQASGDAWHQSQPGILHAYDADEISTELWNSLQNSGRDNCDNYSKMAPPTIANGKVYLPSFGTKNTGTGQLCVYGLLPRPGTLVPVQKIPPASRRR